MGITVVSSSAANAANAASALPAAGQPGNAPAGDFAALLVQQLLGLPASSATPALALASASKSQLANAPEKPAKEDASTAATPADTGLIPLMTAAIEPRPAISPPTADNVSPLAGKAVGHGSEYLPTRSSEPALQATQTKTTPLPNPSETPPSASLSPPAGTTEAGESAKIAAAAPPATESSPSFATVLASQTPAAQPIQPKIGHSEPTTVNTPVSDPGWGKNVGESVVWMTRNNVQTAQINLNPPQLGPLQITLNVSGDQATAVFTSPHAEVRQAITDAMPHLKEMLAGSGINLGQANIGAQLQQQANQNAPQTSGSGRFTDDNAILQGADASGGVTAPALMRRGRGLVDLFA